jgi:hypothetical protein
VVHEVGDSGDPLRGDVQAVDEGRLGAGRGRDRDRVRVVDVEGKADGDAAAGDVRDRARNELGGGLLEVEVVEGEVEPLLRCGDELADVFGDLEGGLAAVGECPDLERQAYPRTRK